MLAESILSGTFVSGNTVVVDAIEGQLMASTVITKVSDGSREAA